MMEVPLLNRQALILPRAERCRHHGNTFDNTARRCEAKGASMMLAALLSGSSIAPASRLRTCRPHQNRRLAAGKMLAGLQRRIAHNNCESVALSMPT